MNVRVLFFAAHRERLGTGETVATLPDGATVADLIASLRERGEAWATLPTAPAVAVNQSYAASGAVLREGDEVAVIPPVAGG